MPSAGFPNITSRDGTDLVARCVAELGLVDDAEEHDAFLGDVLLDALDSLADRIVALDGHDAVGWCLGLRRDRGGGKGKCECEQRRSKY